MFQNSIRRFLLPLIFVSFCSSNLTGKEDKNTDPVENFLKSEIIYKNNFDPAKSKSATGMGSWNRWSTKDLEAAIASADNFLADYQTALKDKNNSRFMLSGLLTAESNIIDELAAAYKANAPQEHLDYFKGELETVHANIAQASAEFAPFFVAEFLEAYGGLLKELHKVKDYEEKAKTLKPEELENIPKPDGFGPLAYALVLSASMDHLQLVEPRARLLIKEALAASKENKDEITTRFLEHISKVLEQVDVKATYKKREDFLKQVSKLPRPDKIYHWPEGLPRPDALKIEGEK